MSFLYNLIIALIILQTLDFSISECDRKQTKFGFVCKCSANFCDYLKDLQPIDDNSWVLTSSSKDGLRFSQSEGKFGVGAKVEIQDYRKFTRADTTLRSNDVDAIMVNNNGSLWKLYTSALGKSFFMSPSQEATSASITVNRLKTYQKIVGFGGALTGSVSYILKNLKSNLQEHLYKSYFHKDGIAFNMLRTSIGGCDFDLEPWAYNENPINDEKLSNFTKLDDRDLLKIKQIENIKAIGEVDDLKIMAAAWSPPPWMKSNNNWTGYSYLKTEYYQTWAMYHLKFLELMHDKNITIWAISTGNEPLNGVIGWFFVNFMSLGWTPRNQAIYLNDYLGPLIKKSKFKNVLIFGNDDQRYSYPLWLQRAIYLNDYLGPLIKKSKFKNVLIFGNDDQRYSYPLWLQRMNSTRASAMNYLDGFAVHWYWDDIFGPELIDNAMQLFPNKLLLNTESCLGDKPWQTHGPELGSWERAEQYIKAFLQDLQHNFNGWIDWNLILNEKGGPNYVNNFVDAPIVVNTTDYSEFYKQPIYYGIGHFSKFVWPESKRIDLLVTSRQKLLDAVGFQRSDGIIVLILFNSASIPQDVTLNDSVRGSITLNVPARSVHTMLYK